MAFLRGMSKVAEVVGSTYGPKGRNVVIEDEEGRPHITKDGVTVAKSVEFSRPDWNIGASLIKRCSYQDSERSWRWYYNHYHFS